ncbi:hypothetical protein JKP88DRAFT_339299 [Tribonema minus]|uniref:RecQ mediated genome instability protein 1 OB-fold domain-containing protein n=1 Tax=Tribonema minus TaxID=303371 RepID=A0A836C6Q7_9STRA|nr:hypothetical protein JKP88DRAFT_339299 [Tribonema minus]
MADNPIFSVAPVFLAFLSPSLMLRSTCHAFHDLLEHSSARRKHRTVAADAVGSTSLIMWAVQNGMDAAMAQTSCIYRGDMAALLQLRRTHATELRPLHAEIAAARGHQQLVQWLRQRCAILDWGVRLCRAAAQGGQLEVLQWLCGDGGCAWDERTPSGAAGGGHLALLQWVRANGCPWDEQTCSEAAFGRHLKVLQWARANGCRWNGNACGSAAAGGHLAVLQWARANGCPWDACTCTNAAGNGHVDVLQWARANGCPWDKWTCTYAAQAGHPAVLQWARANGCPLDGRTASAVAARGRLQVLQWARANGCPWDKWTCTLAAHHGRLEVLQWARANGCPWDEDTCSYAAKGGHLAVLQWARANGCPWNSATISSAEEADWLSQCLDALRLANRPVAACAAAAWAQFVAADLGEAGAGCLPPRVCALHRQALSGRFVLQVQAWVNISAVRAWVNVGAVRRLLLKLKLNSVRAVVQALSGPCAVRVQSAEQRDAESGKRMLKLRLSDGRQEVVAFEYGKLPDLKMEQLSVGVKLLVANPYVRQGMLMLSAENTRLLGGGMPKPPEPPTEPLPAAAQTQRAAPAAAAAAPARGVAAAAAAAAGNPYAQQQQRSAAAGSARGVPPVAAAAAAAAAVMAVPPYRGSSSVGSSGGGGGDGGGAAAGGGSGGGATHSTLAVIPVAQGGGAAAAGDGDDQTDMGFLYDAFDDEETMAGGGTGGTGTAVAGGVPWGSSTAQAVTPPVERPPLPAAAAAPRRQVPPPQASFSTARAAFAPAVAPTAAAAVAAATEVLDLRGDEEVAVAAAAAAAAAGVAAAAAAGAWQRQHVMAVAELRNFPGSTQLVHAGVVDILTAAKVRTGRFHLTVMLEEKGVGNAHGAEGSVAAALSNDVCAQLFGMNAADFKQLFGSGYTASAQARTFEVFGSMARGNMDRAQALLKHVEAQLWQFSGFITIGVPATGATDSQGALEPITVLSMPQSAPPPPPQRGGACVRATAAAPVLREHCHGNSAQPCVAPRCRQWAASAAKNCAAAPPHRGHPA